MSPEIKLNTAELQFNAYFDDDIKINDVWFTESSMKRFEAALQRGTKPHIGVFFDLVFKCLDYSKPCSIHLRYERHEKDEYLLIYNKTYHQRVTALRFKNDKDQFEDELDTVINKIKLESGITNIENHAKAMGKKVW